MTVRASLNSTPCHVCGSTGHEVFLDQGNFQICRCTTCGLRFLFPQPTADEVQAYYDHEYFSNADSPSRGYDSYLAEAANHRATFRHRLRLIPTPATGTRLLDVGAAAGYFVEQARLKGWQAEGVEPSEWAAMYAQSELKQPVFQGTLADARFPPGSFDVMTLWEVIEHLADPRAFLTEAARVVRPSGFLILSTPDAGSGVARLLGRRWPGWAKVPEHLYFFDRVSLVRLLHETGFEVQSAQYVSITVTAAFAARRLAAVVGVPWMGRLPGRIAKISLPINPLYDLMLVARRV
jgi:2-polyprenyl-3-methyl-5-hydroxy-6-metoxy-1,4-benzoquinol methylase